MSWYTFIHEFCSTALMLLHGKLKVPSVQLLLSFFFFFFFLYLFFFQTEPLRKMLLPISNVQFSLSKCSCWFMLHLWVENNIQKEKKRKLKVSLRVSH